MDLNDDGYNDILSGSYSRMSQPMAGLFQVLWGQADGSFRKAAELLGSDDLPLIIPADEESIVENICTRPSAVDWDSDGDLDLIVGNFAGSFYLFTGEGKGRFLPLPEKITTGDGDLTVAGYHSDPFPVDWDNDGDIDLVSGSGHGSIRWAENTADGQAPEFAPFRDLIELEHSVEYGNPLAENELTGPSGSTRVWVDDVNGDGKLDVLVGDSVTLVAPAEGLGEEEFKQRLAAWQEEFAKVSARFEAADGDDALGEANASLQALYEERSEFIAEDRTGFVWLYLQK